MNGDMEKTDKKVLSEKEVEEDIQRLKDWLNKQPHLPQNVDGVFLSSFVMNTSSLEEAKRKLDNYFTLRGKHPDVFTFPNRDPLSQAFKESCEAFKLFIMPEPTEEGYRVGYLLPHGEFSKFNHQLFDARWMMMVELAIKLWPDINGGIIFNDLSTIDSSVITKVSPAMAAMSVRWIQDSIPLRVKRILSFNASSFFDGINSMLKLLISKKMQERVIVTSEGSEILKKYLPLHLIPKDYGGTGQTSDELNDYWMEKLVEHRDWFAETSLMVSDESKRPADSKCSYGVEGTFKYIQLD